MGWFRLAERGSRARPIFEFIRRILPAAWIPLTIYWFGIGLTGKVFIIWIGGIVPCVINSYVGVRMTNPVFLQMGRLYGATNWQIFLDRMHPSAPFMSSARSRSRWRGADDLVGAEPVANGGLGFLIPVRQKAQQTGSGGARHGDGGHDRRAHRHPLIHYVEKEAPPGCGGKPCPNPSPTKSRSNPVSGVPCASTTS